MSNIIFNSQISTDKVFISLLEIFVKKGHKCLFVGKFEEKIYPNDNNFTAIYLDFERNINDRSILYELSKFYDYGITYGNESFINKCNSRLKIGLINESLELIPYNYTPVYYEQRLYEDNIEKIYYNVISSLIKWF